MKERILKTIIEWNDKIRKVEGISFRFQRMYNSEVVVFDRYDLMKLLRELKRRKKEK